MRRINDRNLFFLAVALVALAVGIILLSPHIARAQVSADELQRQIDRMQRQVDEINRQVLQTDREAAEVRLRGFERLAALEREVELSRTGGVIGLLGNAAGLWALFNRLGKINRAFNNSSKG